VFLVALCSQILSEVFEFCQSSYFVCLYKGKDRGRGWFSSSIDFVGFGHCQIVVRLKSLQGEKNVKRIRGRGF
jgi:hypothetical protein